MSAALHNSSLRYLEMAAPASIAEWVEAIWWTRGDAGDSVFWHDVLPDGCADLIVTADEARVVGPMTRRIAVPMTGRVNSLGIRFRPGALGGVTKMPLTEIQDGASDAAALRLRDVQRLIDAVGEGIAPKLLVAHVARLFEPWRGLHVSRCRVPELGGFMARNENLSVSQIAAHAGVSVRTLRRFFANDVGLSPKFFARVVRLQNMLGKMEMLTAMPSWADFATDMGFSDQAHMIREFGGFTGMTPLAYWREMKNGRFIQYDPAALC